MRNFNPGRKRETLDYHSYKDPPLPWLDITLYRALFFVPAFAVLFIIAYDVVVLINTKFHSRTYGIPFLIGFGIEMLLAVDGMKILMRSQRSIKEIGKANMTMLIITTILSLPLFLLNSWVMIVVFSIQV